MSAPWRGFALTIGYTVTAAASLEMASIHISSSPVWPPSGIAIAALALWGLRFWPAIAVGAFAANVWASGHWESSLMIAGGNTLEALAGAGILRRFQATDLGARISHVAILALAVAVGATISASIGVASLWLWGLVGSGAGTVLATWWLGNVGGALIIAPILLAWGPRPADLAILAASTLTALVAFQGPGLILFAAIAFWAMRRDTPLAMPMAVLGWAAGGVALTRLGRGPFWSGTANEALLLLQTFLIFLAFSGLILAAERKARRTRSTPWIAAGVTALTVLPILAGATFIGTTLHPTLTDLHDSREADVRDELTASWSTIVQEQGQQLETLRALFHSTNVTSASFRDFVEDTGWEFGPGRSTAIGYAPIVAHADVAAFEQTVRADEELPLVVRQEFSVFPPSEGPFHAPVRHVYPMDPQPGAIGFDLYLDDIRSASLLRSAEVGRPVASAPVEIVRPEGNATGMMLALPVGSDVVIGYVLSAIALPDAASAPPAPAQTDYRVVDVTSGETTLFQTADAEWDTSASLEAWERRWRIDIATPPSTTLTERGAPWFILSASGALSIAFGMVAFAYDSSRDKAIRLGRQMATKARTEEQQAAKIRHLEELDDFRTRFMNMASHELRTPLTPILSNAEILRITATPEQQGPVEALKRSTHRLNAVVSDLLTAARAEARQLDLDVRSTDLATLAAEAVQAHTEAAQHAGIRLHLDAIPSPLVADPGRLAQIIDNFLTNAIKFAASDIHVIVDSDDGPRLRVRDDGRGIDPDQLPRIGEPFVQAPDSPGGSGLGLYICRTLARLHGGDVYIQSEGPGTGTEVTLRLPRPDVTD